MNYEPDEDFDVDDRPVSASWHKSVTSDLEESNKRAWRVAMVAGAVALLLAIALVILLPLKSVEPYTLLVDRQTGNVEALKPTGEGSVTPDESLTRSFLVQYVTARESFVFSNLQEDYRKVSLWSDKDVRRGYADLMDADNPSSPLSRLPRSAVVKTEVKSVSPLEDNKALVRFVTTRTDGGSFGGGFGSNAQHWVAVIGYKFTTAEMSEADRFINPLGFQVTSYRRDAETLPGDNVPPASAGPTGVGPVFDVGPTINTGPTVIVPPAPSGSEDEGGDSEAGATPAPPPTPRSREP